MNNSEFVAAAREIYNRGYGYIWGAKGEIATEALLQRCIAAAKATGSYTFTQTKINFARLLIAAKKPVTDCSGLLANSAGISPIGSAQIWAECTDKGTLPAVNPEAPIPQIAGLIVYRLGHIGIFLGDGWVVESGGYSKGVVYTRLSEPATGSPWTGYGKWKRIEYVNPEPAPAWTAGRVLKLTSPIQTGDDVRALQTALTAAGCPCGVCDGGLGPKTDAAIRAFQAAHGLTVDGKAGRQTITALGGSWTGK